jgi:hypothetical protein
VARFGASFYITTRERFALGASTTKADTTGNTLGGGAHSTAIDEM